MNEKRFGSQEPTVWFTLPYQHTRGEEAIEIYEQSGRESMEWQQRLVYDMMAVDDDGLWVHSRYGYSLPRQNGKNEVISIREMYGLSHGERILHTAHRTATSRSAWERLVMLCESSGIREIKGENRSGYTSGKSKGQEWIQFDDEHGGGRCSFRTRSTTGGLGETFDLLVIDEAQEYQDDQESALKYTIVSSDNPQTVFLGTPPTPYSSGTIFPKLRRDILTGSKPHAGWAEWSIDSQTDVKDKDAWYKTNPSLGYKLSERAVEDELGGDIIDFNIQRLGLWIQYNQKSAISQTEWKNLQVEVLPKLTSKLGIGIKFNKDGETASMSVAAKTDDSRVFVECYACRTMRDGVAWMVQFLAQLNPNYVKICADGQNGLDLLENALKDARLKGLHRMTVQEFINANAAFEQSIFSGTLCHMEQPSVEQIISNCDKRAIGSGGGFGYKELKVGLDISILDSIILAEYAVMNFTEHKRQGISY